jgi:hypothetical protein
MEFQKTYIKEIYTIEKVDLPNQAIPQENKVILCQNIHRTIQRIPNNRVFAITGMQLNNKATYIMYSFKNDVEIPQEATIVFSLNGAEHSGKVKFHQDLSEENLGYTREYYIQSDNL